MWKNRWLLFAVIFIFFSASIIYGSTIILSDPEKDKYTQEKEHKAQIKEETDLLFRKEYEEDDFVKYFDEDDPPEMFSDFDFVGFDKDEMVEFLPDSWKVEEFSEKLVTLVYEGEEFEAEKEEKTEKKYISIYEDRIAIYKGKPPEGELMEVTPYMVKDVYKSELKEGIPYTTEEEREQILESYTS